MPTQHKAYPWIAALAVAIMLGRSASTVNVFNHTVDEPFHIAAAVGLYQAHKHVADATHPPVAWLVAGFPLWRIGVHVNEFRGATTILGFPQIDHVASQALFGQSQSYWTILREARLAMLVFPVVAMFYLYLLGRWLANERVAMLAVVFFSTDPTLLGHSALVNNDVAACAAFLAGLYYGLRWIVSPSTGRAIVAGSVLGLALATKFTLTLIFPSLLLILLVRPLPAFRAARVSHPIRAYFRRWPSPGQFMLVTVFTFVVLWAAYLFNVGRMQDQTFFDYTPKWNNIPAWIRNATIPMPSLAIGLMYQIIHSQAGHQSYLNGLLYPKGSLLFFPECLLIKEPLALVGGFLVGLIAWIRMPNRRPWRSMVILLPALVYLLASVMGHIMIGIRHLLPILPLLYLFLCFVLARRRSVGLVIAFIVLAYVETAWVHPDYLVFANAGAGGPSRLHEYFADSNGDWGQDIARFAKWLKSDPRARDRAYSLRLFDGTIRPLLTELGLDPRALDATPHGIFAISRSIRAGFKNFDPMMPQAPSQSVDYSWLDGYPRIAVIGSTIDVYDLGEAPTTNLARLSADTNEARSVP